MPTKLTDTSPMPFGKHRGIPMQDVPVSYLHYLWTNGMFNDHRGQNQVADYIFENLNALKLQNKDLIWE